MAYIYMPLIFAILGYGIVYLAVMPALDIGSSMASLVLSATASKEGILDGKSFQDPGITEISQQPLTIAMQNISYPEYGDVYGRLECADIGLNVEVYYGDDSQILRSGAGQYIGSGIPGGGRQILVAGHNVTVFAPLQSAAPGQIVTFTTSYGVYQYQIADMKVLDAKDTTAYDLLAPGEKLVLYTCYPFTALGSTSQRYFLYGDKIAGPDIVE